MHPRALEPLMVVLLVVAVLLVGFTTYDYRTQTYDTQRLGDVLVFADPQHAAEELNSVAAFAGLGLLAFTFLLGPLSRLQPKRFLKYLWWRKQLGISGFALAALHGIFSMHHFYGWSIDAALFANPKALAFATALLATVIFLLMALTSTKGAMQKMGYPKWKLLQRTGYLALLAALIHFIVIDIRTGGNFSTRPLGWAFLFLAAGALALKLASLFIPHKKPQKYEHHVGETPPKEPKSTR